MKRFKLAGFANDDSRRLLSSEILYPVLAGIWLALVALGLGFLMRYANAPGEQGNALLAWPVDSGVPRSDSKPTLLLFAHPKCPCTRATLEELSWIMTRCKDRVECQVLFFHADGAGPDWVKTDCWHTANSIEGVNVISDPQSRSAARFGVRTSGHVLLYDPRGRLLFEGGITPSRGHPGDNPGRATLLSMIRNGTADSWNATKSEAAIDSTCVFGCPLHAPEVAARRWPDNQEG